MSYSYVVPYQVCCLNPIKKPSLRPDASSNNISVSVSHQWHIAIYCFKRLAIGGFKLN